MDTSRPPIEPEYVGDLPASAVEEERLLGLLEEVAATQALVRELQAREAQLVAEFVEGRRAFDLREYGVWTYLARRVVASEIAEYRGTSAISAERFADDCVRLVEGLPAVLDRVESGAIDLAAARTVARETATLSGAALELADEVIAEEVGDVLPGQVRGLARTRVMEIDPDAAAEASEHARRDRFVASGSSIGRGRGSVIGHLPTEQAAACWNTLDRDARAHYADPDKDPGDDRTVSQIMADLFVERLTGQVKPGAVVAHVDLVMTDLTLLGIDDRPAVIPGFGPVAATIARMLAATKSASFRRLFTDPVDASVVAVDTKRRRFDGALREFIMARDRRCRAPACTGAIRDVDHPIPWALGGATSADNGQGLCQRSHHLRDHPGVYVDPDPTAVRVRWRSPIGVESTSIPPPALGPGTATWAQLQHRRRVSCAGGGANGPAGQTRRLPGVPTLTADLAHASVLEQQLQTVITHAA